jgi:multiple RNA-binding domain-containing protein 1
MGSSSKTRTWANDDEMIKPSVDTVPVINQSAQEEEELQELPSRSKKPKTEKPTTVPEPEQPEPMVVDRSEEEVAQETSEQDKPAEPEVETAPVSDADWLRSKTSRLLGLLDEEEQEEFDQHKATAPPTAPSRAASPPSSSGDEPPPRDEESRTAAIENIAPNTTDIDSITEAAPVDPNIDLIRNSARLFLRNLAYDTTESDLQPIFERFGKIEEVSAFILFLLFSNFPHLSSSASWLLASLPRVLI